MPSSKRSVRTPQTIPDGWESLPLPKDVAEWLILRAENTGMPRATIMREAVEAYKRSLIAPRPIVQVNTTTTTSNSAAPVPIDPQSFEAFVEMMGFCDDCQRDIRSYLEQYHLTHQWLIRKAINGLFSWAPHAESCPKPVAKAVGPKEDAPCPSTPTPTPPTPTS